MMESSLSAGIPSRSNYVVKSERILSICLGLLRRGHIIDLATLCRAFLARRRGGKMPKWDEVLVAATVD
jgi:hypothetical protein